MARHRALVFVCAAFAFFASVAVACDRGDGTSATPTPSAVSGSPLPTSTPTPPPPDPTLAERLRYEGDYAAAARVYAEIAAAGSGEEAQEARLTQAQLLLREGLPGEARSPLEAYIATAGAAAEGSLGQYLLASTLDDLVEGAAALDLYSRYVLSGGLLSGYANIERAKLLAGFGRAIEAEDVAAAVLADADTADLRGSFALSMASAYAAAALDTEALAWYALVEPNGGDVATALVGGGLIKQRLGDLTWTDDYARAIALAPGSSDALDAVNVLDAAAVPVSDYVRGLVQYRAFENAAARLSFDAAIAAGDRQGEAAYYLGALDEREDDDAIAITHYQQSYDLDPQSALAADSLWWRGRLLENAGRYQEAQVAYSLLAADYPQSEWAAGAAFRSGLVEYKAGDLILAARIWGELGSSAGAAGFRARFWQGRALRENDDPLGVAVLELLSTDPDGRGDFYALRAQVLLGENIEDQDETDFGDAGDDPDWEAIAAAVDPSPTGTTTAAPTRTPVDLDADPRWAAADALEAVTLRGQADRLRSKIITGAADDPRAMFAIVRRFYEQGELSYTARAAATLIELLPDEVTPSDDLLRLAYPPAFADLIEAAAGQEDVDPLVFMALMRQESLYDPDAGSTAGAVGLTQIVPSTGDEIAAELGATGFTPTDLFRPRISVRFGVHFIEGQIASFDGNIYHALAAYNGGPGAPADALTLAGAEDIDLFVEELEFDETRLYVRLVMEHYAQYRHLYAGVERPSLPR